MTEDSTKTDEEAADIDSPQGSSGDPQPAAARGDDGSTARGNKGSVARGDVASAHGEDGSTTRGFPRPAKGRDTRAFGGPG